MERKDFQEKVTHGTRTFPLACYQWQGEFDYTVNMHWHKELEIVYFEKGTFAFFCDGTDHQVEAPALAFVNAEVLHSLELRRGQKESAIVFDCRMLSYEWYDEAQSVILKPLISQHLLLPSFLTPEDEVWQSILGLYRKIIGETKKDTAASRLRVKLYLTELLSELYERGYLTKKEEKKEPDAYQLENVEKAISYIRDHYTGKIRIGDLAGHVGMSEQYFCRYFKKMTGKTVTEYINEVRVDKATELLAGTEERVIDIAIQCGYENISYFIKRFKQVKGTTPQEYRKENRT